MFTGLVEDIGTIRSVVRRGEYARIVIASRLDDISRGDSVSVDGVCQTVVERSAVGFAVDSLAETLSKTTLGRLVAGDCVNLERAVRADTRLGGHIVQGHVAAAVPVIETRREQENTFLVVELPRGLTSECVLEGSIAVDGVSLTIARVAGRRITINVIPETMRRTTLGGKSTGELVNIETDILGRYVRRLVERILGSASGTPPGGLSKARLAEWGFVGEG